MQESKYEENKNESNDKISNSKPLIDPIFKEDIRQIWNSEDIQAENNRIAIKKEEIENKEKELEEDRKKEQEKLKKERQIYTVKAIQFDWLFNEKEGKSFLIALSKIEDIEIFGLNIISTIIMFIWGYYRTQIVIQVLIPFLLYFTVFILYSTWIKNKSDEENGDFGSKYFIVHFAMLIFLIIAILWMAYSELRQIIYYKWKYFSSFWNWVNFWSLGMSTAAVVTDFAGISKEDHIPILAIATLLMWLKLFYFGRIFLSTAWMVRMINAVTFDMRYFLLVFGIMVLGFANAFYVLSRNGSPQFTGENFWYAIIYSYRTGIGDFNTDDFDTNSEKEVTL